MSIAAMAEGDARAMEAELGKIVGLVVNELNDPYPRVRYAVASACERSFQPTCPIANYGTSGQCSNLEEIMQAQHHEAIFGVLLPTLGAPEPRVQVHAAAA